MAPQMLIPISFFLMIFGIFYIIYSSRNRERLALIEKGIDASIFMTGKNPNLPIWKVFIVNFAFLLIGCGVGIFTALLIVTYTEMNQGAIYPATILIFAGIGLLFGFSKCKNLDKE